VLSLLLCVLFLNKTELVGKRFSDFLSKLVFNVSLFIANFISHHFEIQFHFVKVF